ncbi:hypothetical protein AQUCO_01000565v1 [Aquilegia coerulea]|uniref:BED-type domain-containing protein n=1 Tax=Aquilegia coerulea TaxID=218851 RepID=A0A2G5EAL3_AQUCA|nr:hypothetical protein AQUCO_01000565v1 [Aquilegia coerulea]
MDASTIPVICYFGGNLSSPNVPDYIGGKSAASFINRSITLSELCDKIKDTCRIYEGTVIKLKCRYPLNQSTAITLDICDDSSLAVAMATIPTMSSSLVVYVEELAKQTVVAAKLTVTRASPSKIGTRKDIGWLHCTSLDGTTNKTQCNYCGKVMSGGGITRVKKHLAGGTNDVENCTKCGPEVRDMFRDLIRGKKQSKFEKRLKEQQYRKPSLLMRTAEDGSPAVQSQFSGEVSSCQANEEMLFVAEDFGSQ